MCNAEIELIYIMMGRPICVCVLYEVVIEFRPSLEGFAASCRLCWRVVLSYVTMRRR